MLQVGVDHGEHRRPGPCDMPASTAGERPWLAEAADHPDASGRARRSCSATSQVRSGLSSSTTMISWGTSPRATCEPLDERAGTFSASLKVGVMTDSDGGRSAVGAGHAGSAALRTVTGHRSYRRLHRSCVRARTLPAMCGRFVAASPPAEIAAYFDVDAGGRAGARWTPPTTTSAPDHRRVRRLQDGGTRRLDPFHWGLVPSWAKDMSVGNRMINARAETIATKRGVQVELRQAALHHARRRLLRVEGRPGPEDEAAVLHPPSRRRAVRVRRAVGRSGRARGGPRRGRPDDR